MLKKLVILLSAVFLLAACSTLSSLPGFGGRNSKVKVYFTKANDELGAVLITVDRKVEKGQSPYETAMRELFKGPNQEERERQELNTEIPNGTRLIKIKETKESVEINVSSQLMVGGGAESMQVRLRQLRETALSLAKGRPVFLLIDGQQLDSIGGEGLEIPHPLN